MDVAGLSDDEADHAGDVFGLEDGADFGFDFGEPLGVVACDALEFALDEAWLHQCHADAFGA